MRDSIEKKRLAILRVLRGQSAPVSSQVIQKALDDAGFSMSERTIRFHLQLLDEEGLTRYIGRQGRLITPRGAEELDNARVFEKVGFFSSRIDQMTYRMSFDLQTRKGSVIVNVSLIELGLVRRAAPLIQRVFKAGYAMGTLVGAFAPGTRVGNVEIPEGYIGIGTICSITLNGVLLQHGIPVNSRFGGLLAVENHAPFRFVEIINYNGTSLDPLEIFIKGGMTDYLGATESGTGRIGVGFREVPADSRDEVLELAARLGDVGLGAFLEIGWPGQPLLEIPVSEGSMGIIVIGGLNAIAILEEVGMRIRSRALSGLVEFSELFPYTELPERLEALL